ncbi:MAG TPA: MOSC domain-containing protein [Opitutaceae bacterium]|nr:MOSC domain-containing protein [Opitutaceae bacterium]
MPSPEILRLYVSTGHAYFGRHGLGAADYSIEEREEIRCVAGRGIEGDRFFDYKPDYKGQITFFAEEVYLKLSEELGVDGVPPSVFRRNVITRDLDLNSLVGEEFELQGVRFLGAAECKPCYWMNSAFHSDAEARLQGRGGLRAKILTTGSLRRTTAGF